MINKAKHECPHCKETIDFDPFYIVFLGLLPMKCSSCGQQYEVSYIGRLVLAFSAFSLAMIMELIRAGYDFRNFILVVMFFAVFNHFFFKKYILWDKKSLVFRLITNVIVFFSIVYLGFVLDG